MSRESAETFRAPDPGVEDERDALAIRLAQVERAYHELAERLSGYERERAEIKARLEGILARLGPAR
jgi:uncharacterized protein YhaN